MVKCLAQGTGQNYSNTRPTGLQADALTTVKASVNETAGLSRHLGVSPLNRGKTPSEMVMDVTLSTSGMASTKTIGGSVFGGHRPILWWTGLGGPRHNCNWMQGLVLSGICDSKS